MRRQTTALLILAPLLLQACSDRAPEGATVIHAARLYAAPDQPPIDDAAILIVDGRIAATGPRADIASRGAAAFAQCDGGTVVAGFQNSHVHFTGPDFADAVSKPAAELTASLDEMLNRFGFTTVVDTASRLENTVALRNRVDANEIAGPRILTAGGALYPRNGIPIYLKDLPPEFLASLAQPGSVEEALARIEANIAGGADATKLFLMTPQGGGRYAFMQPDVALAASDETHRRGLPVLAHPTDIEGINLAIEAGVDVLVHTTLGEGKTVWEPALIEQMIAKDMAVIPTLQLWPYELKKTKLEPRIVELATGDAVEQVRAFAKAGGQVLFGTDVGYMSDYDPSEEYRLMARALSPMEILASLTTAPAERWNEKERRGRIDMGLDADLVVLEADPAADAANFAKVRCTFRGGRLIHGPKKG